MSDESKPSRHAGRIARRRRKRPKPAGSALPEAEIARLTDEIVAGLKTVYDPEIPADIYELGLIYKIDIADDRAVTIDMTLTTPNCPAAQELADHGRERGVERARRRRRPRSTSSGIRRGIRAACRTRLERFSTCGELHASLAMPTLVWKRKMSMLV